MLWEDGRREARMGRSRGTRRELILVLSHSELGTRISLSQSLLSLLVAGRLEVTRREPRGTLHHTLSWHPLFLLHYHQALLSAKDHTLQGLFCPMAQGSTSQHLYILKCGISMTSTTQSHCRDSVKSAVIQMLAQFKSRSCTSVSTEAPEITK